MSESSPGQKPETQNSPSQLELAEFNTGINALLPLEYQYCLDSVNPNSMGSAALKFDSDSRIAWDQIWTHFCDLAMAGGPPHRGTILEAPTLEEVEAEPAGYHLVCEELIRGIRMTTGLDAAVGPSPGWITVTCRSEEMAQWLLRAIMAENVFVRCHESTIQVPAGPTFRLTREVKNVIVSLAKTSHYWEEHFTATEKQSAASFFEQQKRSKLLEPPSRAEIHLHSEEYQARTDELRQALNKAISRTTVASNSAGWVGVKFPDERTAAWFVRSAIALNILARREEDVLYLPVPSPHTDSLKNIEVVERMQQLHRLFTSSPSGNSI